MTILLALLGAGSGGAFLAVGAAANARLRQSVQSPVAAAAVNFTIGFSTLTLLLILRVFSMPSLDLLLTVPWWGFLGGFLGATFVTLSILVVPKLGLTTTTLAVVCSQMMFSLVIDQLGWFSITPRPMTVSKVIAIGLLIIAVTLTQFDRESHSLQANSKN